MGVEEVLGGSSSGGFWLVQVVEDLAYEGRLGDERKDTEFSAALTQEGVGHVDPSDQMSPSFSESGALF